jgi:hypothetical protein
MLSMIFDPKLEKLKQAAREADRQAEELRERLLAAKKAARAATCKVTKATGSRSASAHALYAHQEEVGYTGDHASALYFLRNLDFDAYQAALRPFAEAKPERAVIAVEYEAVTAKFEEWSERGAKLYLAKEWRAYERDCESFERWQAENPDKTGWRDQPATRRQYFLMWRTAMARDIDYPKMVKRGVAHDWLMENGANVRLRGAAPEPKKPTGENGDV